MAFNKEIFGMIIFVVGITGFLTLFIASPQVGLNDRGGNLNFNSTGSLVLSSNSNVTVANGQASESGQQSFIPANQGTNCIGQAPSLCSGDYTCTNTNTTSGICISTASAGIAGQSDCININTASGGFFSSPTQFLSQIGNKIAAGFQNLALFFSGQQTITPSPTQCNGVGTISGTLSTFGAVISGQNGNPYTNKNYGTIDNVFTGTLAIAGIFVGLGLLAGVLGAGQFANVIAAVGIGMSLIFFFQGVFASTAFSGTPFIIQIFIDAITASIFIWIIIVMLRD